MAGTMKIAWRAGVSERRRRQPQEELLVRHQNCQ